MFTANIAFLLPPLFFIIFLVLDGDGPNDGEQLACCCGGAVHLCRHIWGGFPRLSLIIVVVVVVALIVADKQFILFKTILHTNAICDKKSEYFVSYRYFNEVVILV